MVEKECKMTIKDLAEVAGCNEKTIRRLVTKVMPGKMKRGDTTKFTYEESMLLMKHLPKRNMVGENSTIKIDKRKVRCIVCGFDRVLHKHHLIYKSKGGKENCYNLVYLCPNHHGMLHNEVAHFDGKGNFVIDSDLVIIDSKITMQQKSIIFEEDEYIGR